MYGPIWPSDIHEGDDPQMDATNYFSLRTKTHYKITGAGWRAANPLAPSDKQRLGEFLYRDPRPHDRRILIDEALVATAIQTSPPSVQERLARGLGVIARYYPDPGDKIDILSGRADDNPAFQEFLSAAFVDTQVALIEYLSVFAEEGSIRPVVTAQGMYNWNHQPTTTVKCYLNTQKPQSESDRCFVAMWFNEQMDEPYTEGIAEAVRQSGYYPVRVDREEFNEKIDDQIMAEIKRSRFVIADFTSEIGNPRGGVYFEAGFGIGISIPVIFSVREDQIEHVHFDTKMFNHIVWTDTNDLRDKLKNRILATIGEGPLPQEN